MPRETFYFINCLENYLLKQENTPETEITAHVYVVYKTEGEIARTNSEVANDR